MISTPRRDIRRIYSGNVAPNIAEPPNRFATHQRVIDHDPTSTWRQRERRTMAPHDFLQLGVTTPDELRTALERRWGGAQPPDPRAELIEPTVAVAAQLRQRALRSDASAVSDTAYVMY